MTLLALEGAKISWAQGRKVPKYGPDHNNYMPGSWWTVVAI